MTEEEVREIAVQARRESEAHATDDPTYAEMMSAYADLGDLLATDHEEAARGDDIKHAASRAFSLSALYQNEAAQLLEVARAHREAEAA